ncbi:MAG: NAD-dependent epimerase/dehydratase family protein [Rhodobacteraceae bacterium]|nr:NAD-dependent epimerase/dehydratase family protein [Paracoccaceae bacterium]
MPQTQSAQTISDTSGSIAKASAEGKNAKDVFFLGSSGRLGRLLRPVWPGTCAAIWHARSAGLADISFDPLAEGGATLFSAALQGHAVLVNLAGPARAAGAGRGADHAALALAALQAAGKAGLRHVFLMSSAAVYGRQSGPAREDGPALPVSDYGHAKLAMEKAAARWRANAGRGAPGVTCLRLGNVAGADLLLGGWRPGRTVMLDMIGGTEPLRRSYIGPAVLAQCLAQLVRLAMTGADLPFVLNVAQSPPVSMSGLLQAASVPWQPRLAERDAIAEVNLDTGRLSALIGPLPPADAAALVADWRGAAQSGPDLDGAA